MPIGLDTYGKSTPEFPNGNPLRRAEGFKPRNVMILCAVVTLLLHFGTSLTAIPLKEALETIICRGYHHDLAAFSDPRCKAGDVQAELTDFLDWQDSIRDVPGLLTAIAYGLLSDRYGRRNILGLSVLGITLSTTSYFTICSFSDTFPVRMTGLASIFTSIGGGQMVFMAMVYAIASDVLTDAQRSTAFFFLAATSLVGEHLASPWAEGLMKHSLGLPMYLGVICLVLATAMAFCVPETRNRESTIDDEATGNTGGGYVRPRLNRTTSGFPRQKKQVVLLMATVPLVAVGSAASNVLYQNAMKRGIWTWAKTSSLPFAFGLLILVAILPATSHTLITRCRLTSLAKDLWLARGVAVFVIFGVVAANLLGVSTLNLVYSMLPILGVACEMLVRSLLVYAGGKHNAGLLFTIVSTVEIAVFLLVRPWLALSFSAGSNWDGAGRLGSLSAAVAAVFATTIILLTLAERSFPDSMVLLPR